MSMSAPDPGLVEDEVVDDEVVLARLLFSVTEAASSPERSAAGPEISSILLAHNKHQRAALAADPLCPTPVLRQLALDRPVVQRGLSRNPTFIEQVMPSLVSGFDWERILDLRFDRRSLRVLIHPHCPADLRESHLEPYCWFDPVRWLLHPELPPADFRAVVYEASESLVAGIVKREELRGSQLAWLAGHRNPRVRLACARATRDAATLVRLSGDEEEEVRRAAGATLIRVL